MDGLGGAPEMGIINSAIKHVDAIFGTVGRQTLGASDNNLYILVAGCPPSLRFFLAIMSVLFIIFSYKVPLFFSPRS